MQHPRLSLALNGAGPDLPVGPVGVFAPADAELGDLPKDQTQIITTLKTDHDRLGGRGFTCVAQPDGRFAWSVVFLPRAKALGKHLIAQAVSLTDGPVFIDGQKNDGIDSMFKALKKSVSVSSAISKAHGKLFWIEPGADLRDWIAPDTQAIGDGFVTAPGVFSADGIDPASRHLVDLLPEKLGAHLADLGAGWGYLARDILSRDGVKTLRLVENDAAALACAKSNVTDERAAFEWADATVWKADRRLDGVIMNPPFHTGRAADPSLGQAFIATAARNLAPHGQLWMVANRHLPYETALAQFFADVKELGGDNRFKVLFASRPSRSKR